MKDATVFRYREIELPLAGGHPTPETFMQIRKALWRHICDEVKAYRDGSQTISEALRDDTRCMEIARAFIDGDNPTFAEIGKAVQKAVPGAGASQIRDWLVTCADQAFYGLRYPHIFGPDTYTKHAMGR